jgi:hypothetical protein
VFISSMVIVIGPTPPGTGVMCEATSLDAVEIDVAAQLAFVVAVHADVDHDRARLDHVGGHVLRRPTADHDDVGLAGVVAQVRGRAMAYGHGGVGLQEQQRHRLADRVRAADHDRVLAAQIDAGGLDQLHAAVGRAGAEARQAGTSSPADSTE